MPHIYQFISVGAGDAAALERAAAAKARRKAQRQVVLEAAG